MQKRQSRFGGGSASSFQDMLLPQNKDFEARKQNRDDMMKLLQEDVKSKFNKLNVKDAKKQ